MITKDKKQEIINEYALKSGDTGSPEVQIAILTARIDELNSECYMLCFRFSPEF